MLCIYLEIEERKVNAKTLKLPLADTPWNVFHNNHNRKRKAEQKVCRSIKMS